MVEPDVFPGDDLAARVAVGITHPRKRAMLAALARTGNISAASRAAGIARRTHYDWLEGDPEYRAAFDIAMEETADVLEAIARQRAIVGSDTLLIFLLKALRPAKFREHHHVEHAGRVETTTPIDDILEDREVVLALHRAAARRGREEYEARHGRATG